MERCLWYVAQTLEKTLNLILQRALLVKRKQCFTTRRFKWTRCPRVRSRTWTGTFPSPARSKTVWASLGWAWAICCFAQFSSRGGHFYTKLTFYCQNRDSLAKYGLKINMLILPGERLSKQVVRQVSAFVNITSTRFNRWQVKGSTLLIPLTWKLKIMRHSNGYRLSTSG